MDGIIFYVILWMYSIMYKIFFVIGCSQLGRIQNSPNFVNCDYFGRLFKYMGKFVLISEGIVTCHINCFTIVETNLYVMCWILFSVRILEIISYHQFDIFIQDVCVMTNLINYISTVLSGSSRFIWRRLFDLSVTVIIILTPFPLFSEQSFL